MTPTPDVLDLVLDWEDDVARGDVVTPEDLCRDRPELLDEVRRCIGLLRKVSPLFELDLEAAWPKLAGYEILHQVGAGGMGVVYKAWDRTLRRDVAVKFPRLGALSGGPAKARFEREARVLAQLRHPNIVFVHAADLADDQPYFVMDYFPRGSLADHGDRFAGNTEAATTLVEQVARAVGYAHQRGVLHRDLKPSNILLDEQDQPLVCDFGLAALHDGSRELSSTSDEGAPRLEASRITRSGWPLGTPRYRAPEQAQGSKAEIGPAADVYSLGVILHELLVDSPVAASGNGRRTALSRDLEAICRKCQHPEPTRRYANATALADDLKARREWRPIQARPGFLVERVGKWMGRHPGLVSASLCASVLAVALGLAWWPKQAASPEPAPSELARASLLHALSRLGHGEIALGLHRLVRTLELTPADDTDLQRVVRANLAGWEQCLCALEEVHAQNGLVLSLAAKARASRCLVGTCTPDLKRGDALLLDQARGLAIVQRFPHGSPVWAVAISDDGRRVATAAENGTVLLWRVDTGQSIGAPMKHADRVCAVFFHPNGQHLLTVSKDGFVKGWDSTTAKPLGELLRVSGLVRAAALRSDGKKLALAGGVVDNDHERPDIGWVEVRDLQALTPSGDALRIVHQGPVYAVAFHPDRQTLVTGGGGNDTFARQWDLATGALKGPALPHDLPVQTVAYGDDGRFLFTGTGMLGIREKGDALVWDPLTGRLIGSSMPHGGMVRGLAVAADGRSLLSVSHDRTVRRWRLSYQAEPLRTFPHPGGVRKVAFHPDGTLAATVGEDGTVRLWETTTGRPRGQVIRQDRPARAVVFTPDGHTVGTAGEGGAIHFWDVKSGEKRGSALRPGESGGIITLAIRPDGGMLALGSLERNAHLLALPGRRWQEPSLPHDGAVVAMAFTPDGRRLLTGDTKGHVRVWDVQTKRLIGKQVEREKAVRAVAYAPDGNSFLVAGDDKHCQFYDVNTGTAKGRPFLHGDAVNAVTLSQDGTVVATGCEDRTVQFWDVATGYRLGPPLRHAWPVRSVAFPPRDGVVLTGCFAGGATWACPAPLAGDVATLRARVQAATGMELNDDWIVKRIDAERWARIKRDLE